MATTFELEIGTEVTLLTGTWSSGTAGTINGLTNNSGAISAAYNNTAGSTSNGAPLGRFKFVQVMGTGATANTAFSLYILKSSDGGTTYESGTGVTSPVIPNRAPDLVIPANTTTTAATTSYDIPIPAGYFEVLLINNGTGQSLASSGNSLTLTPITYQMA
jgi:hypothetical protein